MIAATVLLIGLTAALPSIYQEGQRERETELIFRGMQYARATALFHQQFQRYPTSVSELTNLTNGMRFLRKEFADPMTPGGKWRFIGAECAGSSVGFKDAASPNGRAGSTGSGPKYRWVRNVRLVELGRKRFWAVGHGRKRIWTVGHERKFIWPVGYERKFIWPVNREFIF